MDVDPKRIDGPWKAGYSLAAHTVRSEFLGYDIQGRALFDTTRSEIGETLYRLKYRNHAPSATKLATVVADFVAAKRFPVELVIALPPSRTRARQPVAMIAEKIAQRLGVEYDSKGLRKVKSTPELKTMVDLRDRQKALRGAFTSSAAVKGKVVLLIDDLYRSGASMSEASNTLLKDGNAVAVYAIALTRTRTNR